MSFTRDHPAEFHSGLWDYEARCPVVDGKIEDPDTGEVRSASASRVPGPPEVDIVITNLHDKSGGTHRASRPFPFEKLLLHILQVVDEGSVRLHSVNATQ